MEVLYAEMERNNTICWWQEGTIKQQLSLLRTTAAYNPEVEQLETLLLDKNSVRMKQVRYDQLYDSGIYKMSLVRPRSSTKKLGPIMANTKGIDHPTGSLSVLGQVGLMPLPAYL